jgi:NTP pyrophosphatase (non-canonical NTP hydrolase)
MEYKDFVINLLSNPNKSEKYLSARLFELENQNIKAAQLLGAVLGLSGETGEVSDLVKKVVMQGKPFSDDIKNKLVEETGDILFYLTMLCDALGTDLAQVQSLNQQKLSKRYSSGTFSVVASENRSK